MKIERLEELRMTSEQQLNAIVFDPDEDDRIRNAAKELIRQFDLTRLRQAVTRFEDATVVFVDLTRQLQSIIEGSTPNSRKILNSVVTETSLVLREVAGEADESAPKASEDTAIEGGGIEDAIPSPGVRKPPSPGQATNSNRLSEIADEYRATFETALIRPEKANRIENACTKVLGFREDYSKVGEPLRIPWYFIGLLHLMESSCNFGCHLHNGDPLNDRTVRIPKDRPSREVGAPPFTWPQSATDALRHEGFAEQADWSLPSLLFRLERYNGWGYRRRGLASPYLWSFSDRYIKGKYVKDGLFDPEAVSNQCGAAVVLKRLHERGDIAPDQL